MGLETQTETIADLQAALDAERAVASREAVDALDSVHHDDRQRIEVAC